MTDSNARKAEQDRIDREWAARSKNVVTTNSDFVATTVPPAKQPPGKAAQIGGAVVGVMAAAVILVPLGIFAIRWALGVL